MLFKKISLANQTQPTTVKLPEYEYRCSDTDPEVKPPSNSRLRPPRRGNGRTPLPEAKD
jgi:hypothetical protein